MESFIFVEKKQSNNKNYFLISNYSRSLVLDESTLKNKICMQPQKYLKRLWSRSPKIARNRRPRELLKSDRGMFTELARFR